MEFEIKSDAAMLINELQKMPAGEEISTAQLWHKFHPTESVDELYLMNLDHELFSEAEKNCLYLDTSAYAGMCVGLPHNVGFKVFHKEHGKKCPWCGRKNTAEILYGLHDPDEELADDLRNHRTFFGGCNKNPRNPKQHCFDCNIEFDTVPLLLTNSCTEEYKDIAQEFHYKYDDFFDGYDHISIIKKGEAYQVSVDRMIPDSEECPKQLTMRMPKEDWSRFIDDLCSLARLHEWKSLYKNEDTCVSDGFRWSIELKLLDDRVIEFVGDNVFSPYWVEFQGVMDSIRYGIGN